MNGSHVNPKNHFSYKISLCVSVFFLLCVFIYFFAVLLLLLFAAGMCVCVFSWVFCLFLVISFKVIILGTFTFS